MGETEMKVYLRALEPEDYKISYKWRNDINVNRLLGGNVFFVSQEREKKWVENAIYDDKNNIRLAICLLENNKYIGNVNMTSIDWNNRNAELSIFIGEKDEWGKGYAKDACIQIMEHGFKQLGLIRIHLTVLHENQKAISLYEKLGFVKEGLLRNCIFKDNEFKSLFIMSMLKSEFDIKYHEPEV